MYMCVARRLVPEIYIGTTDFFFSAAIFVRRWLILIDGFHTIILIYRLVWRSLYKMEFVFTCKTPNFRNYNV